MKRKLVLGFLVVLATLTALAQPTITITPPIAYLGTTVEITITGTDEEVCGVEIRDPDNDIAMVKEITLSDGVGIVYWAIPAEAKTGTYTVYVSCEVSGATSETFTVAKPPIVVGGIVVKDYTPLLSSIAAVLAALSVVVALIVKRRG